MAATDKTANYELPIFLPTDKPAWMSDWNTAMTKIDSSVKTVSVAADTSGTSATTAQTTAEQAVTTANNAMTAAGEAKEAATGAVTIANNATVVAGDAQVDAHASLQASTKNATDITNINENLKYIFINFTKTTGSNKNAWGVYNENSGALNVEFASESIASLVKEDLTDGAFLVTFSTYAGNPFKLIEKPAGSVTNSKNLGFLPYLFKTGSEASSSIGFIQVMLWYDGTLTHIGVYAYNVFNTYTYFLCLGRTTFMNSGIDVAPDPIPAMSPMTLSDM